MKKGKRNYSGIRDGVDGEEATSDLTWSIKRPAAEHRVIIAT